MTNTNRLAATLGAAACLMSGVIATPALADAICSKDVAVLAQPRDGLTILEKYKDEFKALSGASFNIDYLNENDRRAKSRADASTVGKYNVYYIDEANIALFASSKWVVPLLDYYPKDYDYADFDAGRQKTATVDGVVYFAPLTGGTDLMVYRKDLLEKAGITPPKTLDEFIVAVQKLNDPDHGVYGIALRGLRGSGANVWRWMPYFRELGGQWFEGNKPVFNSDAFVKATQTYLDLFKYSPPGTKTGSWDDSTGAFLSGHVALLVEFEPARRLGDRSRHVKSPRQGRLYRAPVSASRQRLLAWLCYRNQREQGRRRQEVAGLFIAWATSKENEKRRLDEGKFGELNRTSIMTSDEFNQKFGADLGQALVDAAKVTTITFWQDPEWPTLGDHWGHRARGADHRHPDRHQRLGRRAGCIREDLGCEAKQLTRPPLRPCNDRRQGGGVSEKPDGALPPAGASHPVGNGIRLRAVAVKTGTRLPIVFIVPPMAVLGILALVPTIDAINIALQNRELSNPDSQMSGSPISKPCSATRDFSTRCGSR